MSRSASRDPYMLRETLTCFQIWSSLSPLWFGAKHSLPASYSHMSAKKGLRTHPGHSFHTTVLDVSKGPRGGGVSKGKSQVHKSVAVCPCPPLRPPFIVLLISVVLLTPTVTRDYFKEDSHSRTTSGCPQTTLPTLEEDT